MSNRTRHHKRTRWHSVRQDDHDGESWCLEQAIRQGTWATAGLIPEVDAAGNLAGFWKIMRCGCTFVAVLP